MNKLLWLICAALLLASTPLAGDLAAAGEEAAPKVKISGDLRYRHEYIDDETKDDTRTRQRIRARLGLNAVVDPQMTLGFMLATGSEDPVSTNQTLDGAFSTKDIRLDLAYFDWHPADSGLKVVGGKMKNPFYAPAKTELIWDGDLRPEGMAATYEIENGDASFWLVGGGFYVDERSGDRNAALYGGQGGMRYGMEGGDFTVGAGYFTYSELQGALVDGDFFGNSSAADVFLYDYDLLEAFAEFSFSAGGMPMSVFGDYVSNSGPDEDNTGYLFGAQLNKTKKPGSWQLKYSYREVQKDAVLGAFTDSDFRGGGTDGKGHEFGFGYQATRAAKLGATLFVNKKGVDDGTDYSRLQVDLAVKF